MDYIIPYDDLIDGYYYGPINYGKKKYEYYHNLPHTSSFIIEIPAGMKVNIHTYGNRAIIESEVKKDELKELKKQNAQLHDKLSKIVKLLGFEKDVGEYESDLELEKKLQAQENQENNRKPQKNINDGGDNRDDTYYERKYEEDNTNKSSSPQPLVIIEDENQNNHDHTKEKVIKNVDAEELITHVA